MDLILLGVGLLLTVGTGLFVASEFALVNLDRADLEARRDRGETRLGMTIAALRQTSTHLSSAQLGITLTTLLTGYTLEPAFSHLLEPVMLSWGLAEAAVAPIATVVAVAIATILSMILGELVPKNFALAVPLATAKLVAPFQIAFTAVFRPAVALLNGSANAVLRAFGIEPKEELSGARTAEELSSLVRRSALAGVLEEDTATLLDRSLNFSRLSAGDVMTPRPRVHAVAAGDSTDDVIELARQTGHSRFPVFDESMDDIVGVVHLKAAVAVPRERRADVPAAALATEPLRVPETVHLDQLVSELRSRGYQMAVVVDEYGGTAGVVTLEDLVEEIVGEVADEHDRRLAGVVRHRDSITFPGQLRPDELEDRAEVEVPQDDAYDTVGGYIMSVLERIPSVGDSVRIEGGTLSVERMDGRRVDRVRFTPDPPPEPDPIIERRSSDQGSRAGQSRRGSEKRGER
ncbi:hemolysin family protein [Microbacterium paludicola]|uniref:HlyC/CorC family transporter n=1 Tax=Microbacterium paludicola TaxID=300019 RepID=A0A4Y9FVI8_9MICO|nr:hemolysin family protein [Microbacterium paludicola]MBF0816334.1 HlyC/CorC family transporter [Microbacterium paludicola]TFU32998.1 HlyC/CorC family transporter [Microbacterium paludicola]